MGLIRLIYKPAKRSLDSLAEAIDILENYGRKYNDRSALERADEIRELKQSFEET